MTAAELVGTTEMTTVVPSPAESLIPAEVTDSEADSDGLGAAEVTDVSLPMADPESLAD